MDSAKKLWVDIISEAIINALTSVWETIKHFLINTSYTVGLVGGLICLLFYIAGWEKGARMAGILFVAHIVIRVLLS